MPKSLTIIEDILIPAKEKNRFILVDARFEATLHPKPVVIFIHGFKGFKDWGHWGLLGNALAHAGYCFIKLNLSHNGTTPEAPTEFADLEAFSRNTYSIEMDDVGRLIDYLHTEACNVPQLDLDRIYLIGHSRGGGIALLKAFQDQRVKGVITWASVSDLEKRWNPEVLQKWKATGTHYIFNSRTNQQMPLSYSLIEDFEHNRSSLNIRHAVTHSDHPLLFIHGTADPTVKVSEAYELNSWNPKSELYLIENADHVFNGKHPFTEKELPGQSQKLIDKTLSFLNQISTN